MLGEVLWTYRNSHQWQLYCSFVIFLLKISQRQASNDKAKGRKTTCNSCARIESAYHCWYPAQHTLSSANANKKFTSCAVSSTDFCIKPNVCKCFGVAAERAIASPIASWNANKTKKKKKTFEEMKINCHLWMRVCLMIIGFCEWIFWFQMKWIYNQN